MRSLLKSYAFSVAAAAVVVTATLPGLEPGSLPVFATLVVLSIVSGWGAVRIERAGVQVTPGDMFAFAAIGLAGPLAAPVVAAAATLGHAVAARRRFGVKMLVNLSTVILSGSCAAWAHFLIEQRGGPRAGALLAAAVAFFAINTLVIAGAIRISQGAVVIPIWLGSGAWTFGATVAGALLALGLQNAATAVGVVGLVLGLAGCSVLTGFFRNHRDEVNAGRVQAEAIFRELRERVERSAPRPVAFGDPPEDDADEGDVVEPEPSRPHAPEP